MQPQQRKGRTKSNGARTEKHGRLAAFAIKNQDPEYDYSLQRKVDIQEGGSAAFTGWAPIGESNWNGETFGNLPKAFEHMTAGRKQLIYLDTIACKRPKKLSAWFKMQEDERYNAQIKHVNGASSRIKGALREMDPDAVVLNQGSSQGPGMKQRKGPTEEEK